MGKPRTAFELRPRNAPTHIARIGVPCTINAERVSRSDHVYEGLVLRKQSG